MRIFDQPDHPNYGPVRRMHLILMYLHGDELPAMEERATKVFCEPWDRHMVRLMNGMGWRERTAAQFILEWFL